MYIFVDLALAWHDQRVDELALFIAGVTKFSQHVLIADIFNLFNYLNA
jgi:hypothetical protein